MPRLSVWGLRAALFYLGIGSTLGALMLAAPILRLPSLILRFRPLHAELLLIGWVVQLAFGVGYWILPRLPKGSPRGSEWVAWLAFLLLNLGVLAAGLGRSFGAPSWLPVAGRLAESAAALAFVTHVWPRVRASAATRRA
jgi:cbb3-type cytochrome oxidase subunit 1